MGNNEDDPFFGAGEERTVIRPTPGGRGGGSTTRSGRTQHGTRTGTRGPLRVHGSGLNPIVNAATTLFVLVSQLRNSASHPDVNGLRQHVVQQVKDFEKAARADGASAEAVLVARYCLCTLIDEAVLGTPWGSRSPWTQHSLLLTFHKETFGGEKFFLLLERMLQEPGTNLDVLEVMDICLALGLEGRYAAKSRGRERLDEIKDNLYRTIRQQRGDFERDLSPRWRGIENRRNPLARYVPLWVIGAFAGVLFLGTYAGFSYILNNSSGPVKAQLEKIAVESGDGS